MVVIPNTFTQSQFIKLVISIGIVYTIASISWLIVEMPLIQLGRKIELAVKN
jgi:peptidoglycan/LPS O-acetylase OafA/YrhL